MKFSKITVGLLVLTVALSVSAQNKRRTAGKKTVKNSVPAKVESAAETEPTTAVKKNSRPESETSTVPTEKPNEKRSESVKNNARPVIATAEDQPVYFYEFSKPEFTVSKIYIEHDEKGKGKITFQKRDFADDITDPLQLSSAALERLKTIWQTLNFLDSTENYQAVRDYAHLGTMKFSMKKDGRTRSATFNWTENKDAKMLADEYRKIGQQLVWMFDISVARENQPLDAPRLFDALDSLIKRNEVFDAPQMIPFLKELSNDERIPLIARNRSTKLIEKIEKSAKKKEDK